VRSVLRAARDVLRSRGIEEARLDADLLLGHALGLSRIQVYTQLDRPVTIAERDRYRALVRRRASREPVAYLTGTRAFYGEVFEVSREVLVPRPETELLVDCALEVVRAGCDDGGGVHLADVGTGSGVVAVTVAKLAAARLATVHATDVSAAALSVARRNARRLGVGDRVQFHEGDLLEPLVSAGLCGALDVVVSNPPYVAERDRDRLPPELAFEPAVALFSGPDGLAAVRRLLGETASLLRPGGVLLVEIGYDQGAEARRIARANRWVDVTMHRDLAGHDRVLCARRP
jgi:release factor glutamine methyltransferase